MAFPKHRRITIDLYGNQDADIEIARQEAFRLLQEEYLAAPYTSNATGGYAFYCEDVDPPEEKWDPAPPTAPGRFRWRLPEAESPGFYVLHVEIYADEENGGALTIRNVEDLLDICPLADAKPDTSWLPMSY